MPTAPRTPPATSTTSDQDLLLQQRAVTTSLLGLGIQVALAITGYLLMVMSRTDLFGPIFYFAAGGMLLWAVIAIAAVFRRARSVEAIELEAAVRSGDAGRTIFESEIDARPAARRLARIYRFGIPAVSLIVGIALVLVGLLGVRFAIRAVTVPIAEPAQLTAICATCAFVGFLVGYYLLGMSTSLRWPTLRGGAIFLLGTVLLYTLAAIAAGAAAVGTDALLPIVRVLMPLVVLAVGVELLLNLVLDLYRPKMGEDADTAQRPAFESRLLQLVVSPGGVVRSLNEAINYQFGFEISRSWFWRLLSRSFIWLVVFGVGVLVLLSSFVLVEPHQLGAVTTFGRLDRQPLQPGLRLKWPWPISSAQTYDVTRIRQIVVGTHTQGHNHEVILWDTQDDNLESQLLLVAASEIEGEDEVSAEVGSTPAVALGAADLAVQYRIAPGDGLIDYITNHASAERRLAQMAETLLAREMVKYDIDSAIGSGREQIVRDVEEQLRRQVENERLGLEVVWVGLSGVMPPKAVAGDFNQVVASEQDQLRLIEQGRAAASRTLAAAAGSAERARELAASIDDYSDAEMGVLRGEAEPEQVARQATLVEQQLQQAGGQAANVLYDARGRRWTLENAARAQAERIPALRVAWDSAEEYFKSRQFLRVLAENMQGRPKDVLLSDSPSHLNLDMSNSANIAGFDALQMPQRTE